LKPEFRDDSFDVLHGVDHEVSIAGRLNGDRAALTGEFRQAWVQNLGWNRRGRLGQLASLDKHDHCEMIVGDPSGFNCSSFPLTHGDEMRKALFSVGFGNSSSRLLQGREWSSCQLQRDATGQGASIHCVSFTAERPAHCRTKIVVLLREREVGFTEI